MIYPNTIYTSNMLCKTGNVWQSWNINLMLVSHRYLNTETLTLKTYRGMFYKTCPS